MNSLTKKELKYSADQATKLIGGEIKGVVMDEENCFWGLRIQTNKGNFVAWVDKDPEGNGPGHLQIEKEQK